MFVGIVARRKQGQIDQETCHTMPVVYRYTACNFISQTCLDIQVKHSQHNSI